MKVLALHLLHPHQTGKAKENQRPLQDRLRNKQWTWASVNKTFTPSVLDTHYEGLLKWFNYRKQMRCLSEKSVRLGGTKFLAAYSANDNFASRFVVNVLHGSGRFTKEN